MTDAAPPVRRVGLALGVLCAAFFVAGFALASFGPVLPALSARTGASIAEVGRIMSVAFGGSLLAQFVVGWASDRFGRRIAIGIGLGLFAVCAAVIAASTSLALTLSAAVLMGFGYGGSTLAGNVMSSEIAPERRASSVNLINTFYGVGAVAGPLVVSLLLRRTGASLPVIWIGAALLAVFAVVSALALPDLGPVAHAGDGAPERRMALLDPLVITCGVFTMIYVGSEIAAGTWAAIYLEGTAGLDAAQSAAATSVFWAALTLGRIAATVAGMRIDAEHLLTTSVWLAAAGAALLWAGFGSAAASVVAFALLGLGFGPIYPTAVAVLTSAFPRAAGTATSRMGILAATGGMLLPWVDGLVIAHRPMRDHALLTLAMTIAMIAVWARMRRLVHRTA
jgi:fucose permease